MKQKLMLKYFISGFMILVFAYGFSQTNTIEGDSVVYQQKYGLRIGGDVVKLVRSFSDENYKGFEVNADYRITKNLYVAGELGTEEKTTDGDFFDAKTTGMPIQVTGRVKSELEAAPIHLGILSQGKIVTKKWIVRGSGAFRVQQVKTNNPAIQFAESVGEKSVHIFNNA